MALEAEVVVYAFHLLVLGTPVLMAWRLLLKTDSARLRRRRRTLAMVGLSGISLSVAGYFGMLIHAVLLGGLDDYWGVYRAWAQPGTLLALLSPWLLLAAIGWGRVVGFVAGLLVLFFWYLSAVAM